MYIKTRRLELKSIRDADVDALVALLTDEYVKYTYMVPDFENIEAARNMARRLCHLSEDPQRYVAGIYLDNQLVGLLNETEVTGESLEVGYAILPPYHNQGFATEALRGAIGWFFDRGFAQVTAGAFENNTPSIRVMEKSGMRRIEKQGEIEYRGKTHRCIYYLAEK